MADDVDKPELHKDVQLKTMLPEDLHKQASQKARRFGWSLSAVVRYFLDEWTQGKTEGPSAEDIGRHSGSAPKRPRKTKAKAKRKQ